MENTPLKQDKTGAAKSTSGKKKVKVAKDLPLNELTLRKYEKPYNISKRNLVKKLCLSIGLLNPGDSRDVVVDVLYVLLDMRKFKKGLRAEEIVEKVVELREMEHLSQQGIAPSNIRRQLRRLKELFIVDRIKKEYRIAEYSTLKHIFEDKIERFILPSTIDRIKEYLVDIDEKFD